MSAGVSKIRVADEPDWIRNAENFLELDDGRLLATHHFFFRDGDERPVAEIYLDGTCRWLDREALARRDKQVAAREEQKKAWLVEGRGKLEKQLERKIVSQIKARGLPCRQQVKCALGVIDIVIDGDEPALIEVKASMAWRDIETAIGQLALYGIFFRITNLFGASRTIGLRD
jgi:hypothetical protein